ncbi:MAG: adenosylcobinamide-phosphate synthase CbiB [Geminicoccaceae bacterium]
MFLFEGILFALLLALVLDGLFGDPARLYRRMPHPAALMGQAIAWLEKRAFRTASTEKALFHRGRAMTIGLVIAAAAIGLALQWLCVLIPYGWMLLGVLMSSLLAQRSLADHVGAVGVGLDQGLQQGREAVAHIVGRDPEALDEHGVARAAVESLAENFSDGVVAPVFWGLLLGLPGMLAYKMINTADSMIGYQSERYLHFGRFAAKLDDIVNWLPARLSGLLIAIAALFMPRARFDKALRAMRRDARNHRSPNAGWPEAAMAGALDFRIAGPRSCHGMTTERYWMGDGTPDLTSHDIKKALGLFWRSCCLLFFLVAAILLIST